MKNNVLKAALLSAIFVVSKACAQDPVLMIIAGKPIYKSEFQSIYSKNNSKDAAAEGKTVNDYVQLFVNFKLKVKEAEVMGLDTLSQFKSEFEGYKKQLAQPYLTDNEVNDQLLKEAYERMKVDVRASHLLINCGTNVLPKDSLAAYNKALMARNKILKGEDFGKLSRQISDDPSAKENGGDLGYFTAMQMVYPFENVAYATKVGEVSMPVRTRFGYHLIKVFERRPNQGQLLAAHIMIRYTPEMKKEDSLNAKIKIDEIYTKLKNGDDFAQLASQFSDDKGSKTKGGELPLFGTGRMVLEFEKPAFELAKNGDYSVPVLTQYGWHIIKRLEKKNLGTFEELKPELKAKVTKDTRSQKSKESLIVKIKKEYDFKENLKSRDEFFTALDSSYFEGKWDATKASKLNKELFSIGDKKYTQTDFKKYLESHQSKRPKTTFTSIVIDMYKLYTDEVVMAYKESKLESTQPEFKNILAEYRDGILLFDLTDKKVWSKAIKDTVGLKEFYEKNKSKYMWNERLDAAVYTCAIPEIAKQVHKELALRKKNKSKKTDDDLLKEINKDSQLNLKIEKSKFNKGENEAVDKTKWVLGIGADMEMNKQTVFVVVNKVISPEPKSLSESKGLVTADYQTELEKYWVEELRKKYTVTVNNDVLQTIK